MQLRVHLPAQGTNIKFQWCANFAETSGRKEKEMSKENQKANNCRHVDETRDTPETKQERYGEGGGSFLFFIVKLEN